jgi:type IV pilus assembly protein PilA
MFKNFMKRYLKNQRGLTLIELLATIVILGIISAIAVPAIGGLIQNSKKDVTVANAQQMVNSAKLYIASHSITVSSTPTDISLQALYDDKQIEPIKDPFTNQVDYVTGGAATLTTIPPSYGDKAGCYVEVTTGANNVLTYSVYLKNATTNFIADKTDTTKPVDISTLTRDKVTAP